MKDLEQLEFVFLTGKRPFSDVPRDNRGRIKQQEIRVEGVFRRGDPHPEYDGLRLLETNPRWGQRWVTKEALKRYDVKKVEKDRKYYAANREKARKYYKANKDQISEYYRKWYAENKEKIAAKNAKRRRKLKTNIKLHKDAQKALHGVYKLRKTLDLCARGAGASSVFHVHHTWPLINEEFCGLHAPWNVEIVTVAENLRLSNRRPATT